MLRQIHRATIVAMLAVVAGHGACGGTEPTDERSAGSGEPAATEQEAIRNARSAALLNERAEAGPADQLQRDGAYLRPRQALPPGADWPRDKCTGTGLGGADYCSVCPCELQEGDCDNDAECQAGLYCAHDVGASYGFGSLTDVCLDIPQCANSGSDHTSAPGSGAYCSSTCQCAEGEGDCDDDSECAAGLVCAHDVGAGYGYAAYADVCVALPTCANSGSFHTARPAAADFCSSTCQCNASEGDCDNDGECFGSLSCSQDIGAYYGFGPRADVCEDAASTCSVDSDCTGDWWCLGSSCVYGHVIPINAFVDFTPRNEEQATLSSGYVAYFAWDEDNFYVALNGASVGEGNSNHYVLIYLNGDQGASGTTTGKQYGSQWPGLPANLNARYLMAWRADNGSTVMYHDTGSGWVDAGWDLTGDIYQSGSNVEFRIPLGSTDGIDLGTLPTNVNVHVTMIDASYGWTWAGCPDDSFSAPTGGADDPDYGTFYSFMVGGRAVPVLYGSSS